MKDRLDSIGGELWDRHVWELRSHQAHSHMDLRAMLYGFLLSARCPASCCMHLTVIHTANWQVKQRVRTQCAALVSVWNGVVGEF